MKGITIRFADDIYRLITCEADRAGVNVTSYIREAALARAIITLAQRGYFTGSEDLDTAIRKYLTERAGPLSAADRPMTGVGSHER